MKSIKFAVLLLACVFVGTARAALVAAYRAGKENNP